MNQENLENAKKVFFITLAIDIAVTSVVIASNLWSIDILKQLDGGNIEVGKSAIGTIEFFESFSKVMFLTILGVGFGLVKWLNACYSYAKETVGATGFENEKWTATAWVIPILNLFKPYQIVNEIYKAGTRTYTSPDGWKKESGSGLLLTWWIFWAVTHYIGWILGKQLLQSSMRKDLTLHQSIGFIESQIWLFVFSLIISGMWFVVANALTTRLLTRNTKPIRQAKQSEKPNAPADNDAYAAALAEIEEGRLDKGVWARSFAESGGDESKAKALYIKARAQSIRNADVWMDTQPYGADSSSTAKPNTAAVNIWKPIGLGAVLVIGIVAAITFTLPDYQDYTKRQAVAASTVQSPAKRSQIDEFLDGVPKSVQAPAPQLDLSEFQTAPPKSDSDKKIMKKQGVGGNQDLADVVAWGDAQLSARIINDDSSLRKAHDFALMWQTQIADKLQDSPEHALFMGFRMVMNFYDKNKEICRPNMSMHGGIEHFEGNLAKFYPECFTRE